MNLLRNLYFNLSIHYKIIKWGLGIGDWGLGIGDWAQSPIPNPQSPIPILLIKNIYHYLQIFSDFDINLKIKLIS